MYWTKTIELGENYEISCSGKIKSIKRYKDNNGGKVLVPEKILKTSRNHKGYETITISKNKKSKTYFVHRLVAKYFVPNPQNKPQVNHKDGNKLNNDISNLEWVNNRENAYHYRKSQTSTSKYFGVHYVSKYKKWNSQITIDGKTYSLGYKDTEEMAYMCYKKALCDWEKNKIKPTVRDENLKNISYNKNRKKWHAYHLEKGKLISIGFYENLNEAIKHRDEYKRASL